MVAAECRSEAKWFQCRQQHPRRDSTAFCACQRSRLSRLDSFDVCPPRWQISRKRAPINYPSGIPAGVDAFCCVACEQSSICPQSAACSSGRRLQFSYICDCARSEFFLIECADGTFHSSRKYCRFFLSGYFDLQAQRWRQLKCERAGVRVNCESFRLRGADKYGFISPAVSWWNLKGALKWLFSWIVMDYGNLR